MIPIPDPNCEWIRTTSEVGLQEGLVTSLDRKNFGVGMALPSRSPLLNEEDEDLLPPCALQERWSASNLLLRLAEKLDQ